VAPSPGVDAALRRVAPRVLLGPSIYGHPLDAVLSARRIAAVV